MIKNCSFSCDFYKAYGCFGFDEKYLGTCKRLCDVLDLCRSHLSEYDVFSLYAYISDLSGSGVYLGSLSSIDLKH